MSTYDTVACEYDKGMYPLEWLILSRLRRRVFPGLRGRVLELGVGTGVNLPLYGHQGKHEAFYGRSGPWMAALKAGKEPPIKP